jgi:hypothetical protein
MLDAFIGLGSNLPDRLTALRRAVESLARLGRVRARSAVYETVFASAAARPLQSAALWLETALSPQELLERLREVEGAARFFRQAALPTSARESASDAGPAMAEGTATAEVPELPEIRTCRDRSTSICSCLGTRAISCWFRRR